MAAAPADDLAIRLADPYRPVFLLGEVPPQEGTPPGKCQDICTKFMQRSRALASDGFIVYDIQDEPGRVEGEARPFPFRKLMDSSRYAALLERTSGKQCVVYKCIADERFTAWMQRAATDHGHRAINLVGRPSSEGEFKGPSMSEAMKIASASNTMKFGCVCIAERHTLEAAQKRGKQYPTEHVNMIRKQQAGAQWFISQAVYDPEPTIRLLKDYAASCREAGIVPRKVILTFCPVSRVKTMKFIKWLGVRVPAETESKILDSEKPVDTSIVVLCDMLRTILSETIGIGVPLGISCESVSIYKAEIDGVHELFRRLQGILLDSRLSPWKVVWVEVMPPANNEDSDKDFQLRTKSQAAMISLLGAVVGSAIFAAGILMGSRRR